MTPYFQYQGYNEKGQKVSGETSGQRIEEAVQYLEKNKIIPIDIQPVKQNLFSPSIVKRLLKSDKVSGAVLKNFSRQMSILLSVGVPIVTAIRQVKKASKSKPFKKALEQIAEDLLAGQSFASSLNKHNDVFSTAFINLIDMGEKNGQLEQAFDHLANYYGTQILHQKRMLTAMRYPLIVVSCVVIVMIVTNIFVIPEFAKLFRSFNTTLPLPTRIMFGISDFMINYWYFLVGGTLMLMIAIPFLLTLPQVRLFVDKHRLQLPIFGHLQKRLLISQFAWSTSLTLRSGISIIAGLRLVAQTIENSYVRKKIEQIQIYIEHGKSFTEASTQIKFFPEIVIQMISIGEEAGKLDSLLEEVAEYYNLELEYDFKRLDDLLKPMLLLIIGAMVVVLALSIYLPIWDMYVLFSAAK